MGSVMKVVLKVGLFGIIGIIVLFALFMGLTAWLISSNNQPKGSNQEILRSDRPEPEKALLVYQPSKSKAAGEIAHQIAKGLNDSGYEVTMDYPGKQLSRDVSGYSVLIFGSPVYAGQISSALTGYIKDLKELSGKKVVVYAVGSAVDETKELDMIAKKLEGVKPVIREKLSPKDKTGAYELGKKAAGE